VAAGVLVALGVATFSAGAIRYRRRKRTLRRFAAADEEEE
jgi:hypothetical protein